MRPRHWQRIAEVTNHPFDIEGESFCLRNITDAPLLKYKEDIEVSQTERQTYSQTERQTYRQSDYNKKVYHRCTTAQVQGGHRGESNRQTDRQTDSQT